MINIFVLVLILLLFIVYIFYTRESFSQRENNDLYKRQTDNKHRRKGLLISFFFKLEEMLMNKSKKGNPYYN